MFLTLLLLFFVVFITVGVWIIYQGVRAVGRNISRARALPMLASGLGLRMEPGKYPLGVPPFEATRQFALFRDLDTPSITNVLHGRLGPVDVQLFDVNYYEESGVGADAHSTPSDQWVAMLTADGFSLPSSIDVTARNFLDRAAASLGHATITFAEYPVLSRLYVFGAFDERFLRALLDPGMVEWLTQHPGLCVHGDGRHLLIYRPQAISDLTAMRAFVDEAMAVFQIVAAGTARVVGGQTRTPTPPPLPA